MADLFKNLESNDLKVFNDTKHRFFEQFNSGKFIIEYYNSSNL